MRALSSYRPFLWTFVCFCLLNPGYHDAFADERTGAPTLETTQIFVRLAGPFGSVKKLSYDQYGNVDLPIYIDPANPLFPDWRSRKLPILLRRGNYALAHVFLTVAKEQAQYYITKTKVEFPFHHGIELLKNPNLLFSHPNNNDPQPLFPPVDEFDINGTADFVKYPAMPEYKSISLTNFSLIIDFSLLQTQLIQIINTGAPLTFHFGAVILRVRNQPLCGYELYERRTEVQPLDSPDLDTLPDRISDAAILRSEPDIPQIAFYPLMKGHHIRLCKTGEEVNGDFVTTFYQTVLIPEDVFASQYQWEIKAVWDNKQLKICYPHPPFMAFARLPITGGANAWVPIPYKTVEIESMISTVYKEEVGLEITYRITAPVSYVTGEVVNIVLYFLLRSGALPTPADPNILAPIMVIDPETGAYIDDANTKGEISDVLPIGETEEEIEP